jgi:hypothetical protein
MAKIVNAGSRARQGGRMKLDDGYFENKFRAIMAAYHADLITKIDDILKQIARDAAEEQREHCFEYCGNGKYSCHSWQYTPSALTAAIRAAGPEDK